jgi:voltage-gated potassium channel
MTWSNRWKFTILLVTLLLLFIVHPIVNDTEHPISFFYHALLLAVFAAVIFALFQRRETRVGALVLGIPTGVGILANYFWAPSNYLLGSLLFHLFPMLFLGYTVVAILRIIFEEKGVSADSINGAFCGYLLLGLMFGHVFCLVEAFHPGSFHMADHVGPLLLEDDHRHFRLTYFSLVSLTTLGYGDITPRSGPARSLACVEAIVGQFYVAVVIAELIALKVSAALQKPDSGQS